MASDALDLFKQWDGHVTRAVPRPAQRVRSPGMGNACRTAWSWVSLAMLASAVCALTVELMDHPVTAPASRPSATSLPTSLYFATEHAAIDSANRAVIAAIARAARGTLTPVVVAGYADHAGKRDKNLRLVQKQATEVRNALIKAGIPTLRIVVVSPAFAAVSDARRVEVTLVHGVRAFRGEPAATVQ